MMLRHDCTDTISMPVADSGTSNSWKPWLKAGVALLVADTARIVETLKVWQYRSTWRTRLSDMDDRLLQDIGISRAEAEREISKPFWRS